jgi:hypothetical protein
MVPPVKADTCCGASAANEKRLASEPRITLEETK